MSNHQAPHRPGDLDQSSTISTRRIGPVLDIEAAVAFRCSGMASDEMHMEMLPTIAQPQHVDMLGPESRLQHPAEAGDQVSESFRLGVRQRGGGAYVTLRHDEQVTDMGGRLPLGHRQMSGGEEIVLDDHEVTEVTGRSQLDADGTILHSGSPPLPRGPAPAHRIGQHRITLPAEAT